MIVDLHHTSGASFTTGIQRVAREVVRRWVATHDVVLVGWLPDYAALYRLPPTALEISPVDPAAGSDTENRPGTIVVPWHCTYLVPELLGESGRVDRFQALAHYSGNQSGVIGFDCVPITTGETAIEGMEPIFALPGCCRTHRPRGGHIGSICGGVPGLAPHAAGNGAPRPGDRRHITPHGASPT